jgi:hypothetical protein
MGWIGHCAVGMAAKPWAPKAPLGVLLLATISLDLLAIAFALVGIENSRNGILPWSHGLFMSMVWSVAVALLVARIFHSYRAGVVAGLMVVSHWVLDFVSHPIPFDTFSWRTWQWSYGHPLPSDLPIFFARSPRVGLGLYNSISAVQATVLEIVMFLVGTVIYIKYVPKSARAE